MSKYFDDYIEHSIYLEYYGNQLSTEANQLYEDFIDKAEKAFLKKKSINTKTDVETISKKIQSIIEEFINSLESLLVASALEEADKESSWLSNLVNEYAGVTCFIPNNIGSKVEYAPYDNRNTIQTFLFNTKNKLNNVYGNAAKAGYSFGTTSDDLMTNINQNLKPIQNGLKTETQTMGSSFAKNTQRIIYSKNESIFANYQWSAILDSSTCIVCGNLDGTVYESINEAPVAPIHDRCRCMLIGIIEGQSIPKQTYSEWLSEQNDSTQRKILGKSRYEMYKQGLPIRRFVNDSMTEKLTLEEIYD